MKKDRFTLIPQIETTNFTDEIQQEITFMRLAYKEDFKVPENEIDVDIDLEPELRKRRVDVLLRSLKDVKLEYAQDWIHFNTNCFSYARYEAIYHSIYAAAIWILDRITEARIPLSRLNNILPAESAYELLDLSVWDCRYDEDLISRIISVLYNRNIDIAPIEETSAHEAKVLTSKVIASGRNKGDVPSRNAYEQLIALIPQEAITKAVKQFESTYNAWVERFFAGLGVLENERVQILNRVNDVRTRINDLRDKIEVEAANYKKKKKPALNPVLMNPLAPAFPNNDMAYIQSLADRHEMLMEKQDAAYMKFAEITQKKGTYMTYIVRSCGISKEDLVGDFGEAFVEAYGEIPLPDPFEMCFALLYLIESGDSDIPWLYSSCMAMMTEVSQNLPWGITNYEDLDDEIWMADELPEAKPFPIADLYERKYRSKADRNQRNLAQLIYEETGCIMPRNMHRYDSKVSRLTAFGLEKGQAETLLYCMNILGEAKRQRRVPVDYDALFQAEAEKTSIEELQKLLRTKEREIDDLKSALYTAEKQAAESKKKITEIKKAAELERRELADLREIVFNAENDTVEEAVADESIFPYTVQQNTIVFGGHETWSREIKQLLNGEIRFIPKGMIFDAKLIRYADIIWIQSNAMPHRQYYSIISEVRKYNKPVRYFQYASAMKCAEQVADNDKS